MTSTQNKLYVDLTQTTGPLPPEAELAEADGYVLSSPGLPEGVNSADKDILFLDALSGDPVDPDMAGSLRTHISRQGLAEIARLRDEYPDITLIPQADVARLETAYHFPTTHYSEGFRTYQPVFPTQSPYRVSGGDMPIGPWLEKAASLGFETVWLHRSQSAAAGSGLDLDLRELALKHWSGNLWFSGGATTIMHIKYLVQEGGLDALIIPPDLACDLGCDQIATALRRGSGRSARGYETQTPIASASSKYRTG
jgi:hypothetical protein